MTRSSSPSVRVSGLSHAYGAAPVLHDVDLDIAAGECVTLLGPSGCGKTTLLRTLAGLERPLSGTVSIGDVQVAGGDTWVPPEHRRVGMVFQEWALFPHLSVADNVGYGLNGRRDRSGRSEIGRRVDRALDLVGLGGLGDRMPSTLSGGQQQRVALARALAPEPDVLLLDEPFSNLDAALRGEVRTEVHRLLHELEITSVFVTHDQEEAFVLGDRVAVMSDGRIRQVDTPQGLYHEPVDRWVAEFVGSVSTLPGRATAGLATTVLGELPVDPELDGDLDVLVRPEDLTLVEGDTAEVEFVEFYGHDAMVFVALGEGGSAAVQHLQVRTGPMVRVSRGDRVGLRFVGDRAVAFPAPGSMEHPVVAPALSPDKGIVTDGLQEFVRHP